MVLLLRPPPHIEVSELVKLEDLGRCLMTVSFFPEQSVFKVKLQTKPHDKSHFLFLSLQDISLCFRDLLQENHLPTILSNFLTKESILKSFKLILANNVVITRKATGHGLSFLLQNSQFRQLLFFERPQEKSSYIELLKDLRLAYCLTNSSSARLGKVQSQQAQVIHQQVCRIKSLFVIVTVSYLRLLREWEVSLYLPSSQKTFKMFFVYKELVKTRKLLMEKHLRPQIASESRVEKFDRSLESSTKKVGVRQMQSNDEISPIDMNIRPRQTPLRVSPFTRKNLRSFDKQTNTFKDKELTEEFSVQKTELFLKLNAQFHQESFTLGANPKQAPNFFVETTLRNPLFANLKPSKSSVQLRSQLQGMQEFEGESFLKPPMRQHKRLASKTKEGVFNSSYLNCYLNLEKQKKRVRRDSREESSVESKEEHSNLGKINSDHMFNYKQELPFWRLLIKSLSISDKNGANQNKLVIRISYDNLCISKTLHQVVLQQEVEDIQVQQQALHSFNLLLYRVTLDCDSQGLSFMQRVHEPFFVGAVKRLKLKMLDIGTGEVAKSYFDFEQLRQEYKGEVSTLADVRELAHSVIARQESVGGMASLIKAYGFEFKPRQSKVLSKMLEQDFIAARKKQQLDGTLCQQQEQYLLWRKTAQKEARPMFSKQVRMQGGEKRLKLMLTLTVYKLSVVIRIVDKSRFIKFDKQVMVPSLCEQCAIQKSVLLEWQNCVWFSRERKFQLSLAERIMAVFEEEVLSEFASKFPPMEEQEEEASFASAAVGNVTNASKNATMNNVLLNSVSKLKIANILLPRSPPKKRKTDKSGTKGVSHLGDSHVSGKSGKGKKKKKKKKKKKVIPKQNISYASKESIKVSTL